MKMISIIQTHYLHSYCTLYNGMSKQLYRTNPLKFLVYTFRLYNNDLSQLYGFTKICFLQFS